MGYAFDRKEKVPHAVRRITDEQVEGAVSALERVHDHDLEATVHDCRKRAKKLRGLLRLVRPALGSAYGPANELFRDAGRELSTIRDAHATLATFDALVAASLDRLPDGGLGAVRAGLAADADRASNARDRLVRAEVAADLFRAGRRRVGRAGLDARGWAAVGPGLERTYRAGRRALAAFRLDRGSDPTAMHEWRKRTKDAWYHVRLLSDAAPSILEPFEDRFHDLSDALGDAHDLVVICERLRGSPRRFGGVTRVRAACALAEERRGQLERRATRLGVRLYAEKPRAYNDRMAAYWRLWQDAGAEKPIGGLTDLFPPADGLDALDLEQLRDRAGEAALSARLHPAKADLIGELRATGAG
ncbi:MAG TPA: CHAD domain-containing protein [Acidimicrobiales bacterium]|nr:CHAD domain-containing protein [Acidimicrobiales bacterium]